MSNNNTKTSRLTNTIEQFEVAELNPITPLAQRSMFWRPSYLEQSAWLEHIPFAFWLIDAHHPKTLVELGAYSGVSYFAFCQGISRLGLGTRCFAVDAWKDNEQTYDKLSAYNDAQYSGFSRLVRSTFDDALESFSDGSIDLLHIDALHSYETIKHNFETWLPKLSHKAIVILHGINIREKHIGIYKYFEELKALYPWFEFSHGLGLGILGVGKEQNEILGRLFGMSAIDASTQVVREVFSRLGRACTDSFESKSYQDKASTLTLQIRNQTKLCTELQISLEETKKDLDSRKKESIEVKAKMQSQIEQHCAERGQLNERANLLQEARLELKEEVGRLERKLETTIVRLSEKGYELTRLALESADFQRQINAYGEHIKERDNKLSEKDLALNESKVNSEQLEQALQEAQSNNEHLTQALAENDQTLSLNVQSLRDARASNAQLSQAVDESERAIIEHTVHAAKIERELQESRNGNAQLTQALAEKDHALNEKSTQLLQTINTLNEQKQVLENKLLERFDELALLTKIIEERNSVLRTQHEGSEINLNHIARLTNELAVATSDLAIQKETIAKLEAGNRGISEEKDALTIKLNVSFDELATLTKLLIQRETTLRVKEQEVETEKKRVARLKGTLSWKVTKPVRILTQIVKKNTDSISAQIRLISESGLFDRTWYLAQYPDVALKKIDPIKHYMRHGAAEGRDPAPDFDTKWYLSTYRDVAEAGVNPLVHYIKIGKQEGRQPMSK